MPTVTKESKRKPEVVVFDQPSSTLQKQGSSKFAYKAFMSSKISKIDAKPPKPKTEEERKEDEQNKQHDIELKELLEGKVMIEKLHESQLSGKDRHKHNTEKLARLGMKVKSKGRIPTDIYFASQRNRGTRAKRAIQDAKDRGVLNDSMKRELELVHFGKTSDNKRKSRSNDRGPNAGPGKFKDGVLHISKSHIDRINGSSKPSSRVNKQRNGAKTKKHHH
ncbi:hypothetical protein COEREDRAFT_86555 [Coemansia reversa NRRL 1564]|uniref:Uncharacterized protein n=1 Tax=Coemansia reversa (strain ATCC 12441 / NRRL 1564) TaxID=763665 RepID=A0A2G5BDS4_COERN|nr:hypothetical protein COEREDRAFT_86555 [Coemansia reversa NRRL 1564]|eukprot:PIA17168.1 hypothetical protein COEREDRAFT_86555 [Coemansia reversa NRRL 1564]